MDKEEKIINLLNTILDGQIKIDRNLTQFLITKKIGRPKKIIDDDIKQFLLENSMVPLRRLQVLIKEIYNISVDSNTIGEYIANNDLRAKYINIQKEKINNNKISGDE